MVGTRAEEMLILDNEMVVLDNLTPIHEEGQTKPLVILPNKADP